MTHQPAKLAQSANAYHDFRRYVSMWLLGAGLFYLSIASILFYIAE